MKNLYTNLVICILMIPGSVLTAQSYMKIDASFYSQALDEVRMIDIYLPGDYYIDSLQDYATIYYLHSLGGNQNEGNQLAMFYYNQHDQNANIISPAAIFVCPDGSSEPYSGSWFTNSVLYGNYEDFIMQDVISFIEDNFRAIKDKNFRFTGGHSMGGMGSSNLCTKFPEHFRACISSSSAMTFWADGLIPWRDLCYQEHGSYNILYNGSYSQALISLCGAVSPNLSIQPLQVELPFDTLGNFVDTVLNKWMAYNYSSRVKDLPDENELSWFLICGINDEMGFYPTYEIFEDSLDAYGIGYDHRYFDGDHQFHIESWLDGLSWMDSIINQAFSSLGMIDLTQSKLKIDVYPNPVKDKLNIIFKNTKSSNIKIMLYDMQGREIIEIGNHFHQAGKHHETYNISNINSGLYFICMQTEKEIITKKLLIR